MTLVRTYVYAYRNVCDCLNTCIIDCSQNSELLFCEIFMRTIRNSYKVIRMYVLIVNLLVIFNIILCYNRYLKKYMI